MEKTMERKKYKVKRKISAYEIVIGCVLALYSFILIFLFGWAFLSSLRNHGAFRSDALAFPEGLKWKNYTDVFKTLKLSYIEGRSKVWVKLDTMFLNSLIYAGVGGLIQTFFTAAVAYCCARYKGFTSSLLRNVVIVTLIIPVVGTMPSLLDILHNMKLHDTWMGIFVQRVSFCTTYFLIFYAAFGAISWEYAESAFIDGASHSRVFFQIMLPLVKTLLITVFILLFVQYWNDYQNPWMLIPSMPTAARGMYHYLNDPISMGMNDENVPRQIAAGVIIFVPIFTIFVIFRDKIMGNLTEGGIKG